ncbi:MAG: SpoIID/LytB domain-containing protein, partial [Nitrospirota bacterium]
GKLTIKDKKYGGIFDIIKTGRRLLIINRIEIEEYLKGVVPMEMPSSWNMEALKAQSVIARTYALYQKKANKERRFDLVSTTGDQVYGGKNGETVRTNKAVSDTKGLILTYNGGIILSVYHSTSAGPTEDAEEIWSKNLPYLKGVSCPFDKESPFYSWDKIIRIEDVEDRLKRIYPMGTIASITPYLRSKMGRIMGIRIIHSKGELFLKGGEFRRIVGNTFLPSTKFEIVEMNDDIHLSGHGAGHGLGLCQWGAKGMADLGYRFNEILKHYYPGTKIVRRRRR